MIRFIVILCCLSYLAVSNAGKAPFIVPCKLDDEACLLSSAQGALKAMAHGLNGIVDTFDPLYHDTCNADNEDLKIVFNKMKLTGLSNCEMVSVRKIAITSDGKYDMNLEIECPFVATGEYSITPGSKIGFLSVYGAGDCKIETDKIKFILRVLVSTITGSDGQEHWHINSLEYTPEPKEKVYMKFDDICKGDEEKANAIITLMDVQWKELLLKIGKPIIDTFILKCQGNIEQFFNNVPANELYIA